MLLAWYLARNIDDVHPVTGVVLIRSYNERKPLKVDSGKGLAMHLKDGKYPWSTSNDVIISVYCIAQLSLQPISVARRYSP